MLIGYARVSDAEQSPQYQVAALVSAGVAESDVHADVASGARMARPALDLVLQLAQSGDTLVITRLDRLAKSLRHLVTLGAQLRDRGVQLRVLEQGLDTTTDEGRAMYEMLSVLAELQRELITASTRGGLRSARARGRLGGRPRSLDADQAAEAQRLYDQQEMTVAEIAAMFAVTRSTLYGYLDATPKTEST